MILVIAVAGWVVLVVQIAALCSAARRGDSSMGNDPGGPVARSTTAGSEPHA